MKIALSILFLITGTLSHAQVYSHYDVLKQLDPFYQRDGIGSLTKDNIIKEKNKKCSIYDQDIDFWSSEGSITADIIHIYVGSSEVTTDVQGWNPKAVTIQTTTAATTYVNKFISSVGCHVLEKLTITGKTAVSYFASVQCNDRRRKSYTEEATCKF